MFVICRKLSISSPWDDLSPWRGALTRWEGKWYHATSLAKPTIFENEIEAKKMVEGEVKKQYPEDEIIICSVDIFQKEIPF